MCNNGDICAMKQAYIEKLEKRNAELRGMYVHSAREAGTYKQFLESKEKENADFRAKVIALENANRAMVKELDDMTSGGLNALKNVVRSKEQLEYAKTVIQDLLDNSDEYARQRAMDFLEEKHW